MMKYYFLIIIMLSTFLTSCNEVKYKNNIHTKPKVEEKEQDEWVEVKEYVEEECTYCNGIGWVSVNCSECGGWGQKTHYESGTVPKVCSSCRGTGKVICDECGGYGYIQCHYCNGHGSSKCSVCNGYGVIILDPSRPHLSPKCNNCNGSGYEDCLFCSSSGKIRCCDNGLTTCPTCWGSGYYGQERYTASSEEICANCNGSGNIRYYCHECNGSGIVEVEKILLKRKSEL